ncbi:multi-sensor hybrid histidine kinase [Calothrix sp. NIES-2100]|uniref:PAS domain S-box protein n=1 Tax=Calothrix sp. NIES-2100 TaxID=1954172 RepID=UPI000B602BA7|nr:multi-sensor hybrid histidine kinase [Calothrix sp. NIES-2100]
MTIVTKLVLIVDDCLEDRETYRRYLLRDKQQTYRILEAETGKQALELCRQQFPDVILLDYLLPDKDGLELLNELKTLLGKTNLPVIILTGQGNEQIAVQAMKSGAADYLVKRNTTSTRLDVAIQNVLENTRLSRQLEESEARFAATFNQAAVGIAHVGLDGKLLLVNQRLCDLVGYTREKLLRQRLQGITHPADLNIDLDDVRQMLVGKIQTYSVEKRYICQDNKQVWINLTVSLVRKASGEPEYFICVFQDITQSKQLAEDLHRREQQFSTLVENSPNVIFQLDRDLRHMYISSSVMDEFGITTQQFLGKTGRELGLPADVCDMFEAACHQAIASKEVTQVEYSIADKHFISHIISELGEDGVFVSLMGITEDVSARKQAEFTLKQQIRQEHLLSDIAQDIRRSLDLNEVLSSTVQRVRQFLNTDRVIIFRFRPDWQGDVIKESVGAEWTPILSTTIFDPCFSDRYIEPYRQGRITTMDDIDRADLKPCYIELLKSFQVKANLVVPILQEENLWGLLIAQHCSAPHQWQPGEIAMLRRLSTQVSIAIQQAELYHHLQTELADRKLAEQKIREQAKLLDIVSDAIFVRDLNHHILYWNQGAEQMYGYLASEAVGQKANELWQEDAAQIAEIIQTVLEQGEWRGEIRKVTRSGRKIIVAGRWTLLRDESGNPQKILVVNTDITDKKQIEQQFYRAQRLESLGTLASGIAHDLNNILTPMLAVAQLLPLKFPNINEQNQRLLKILEINSKRGAQLVKQITAFARGAEGKRVPLQPRHLLKEIEQVIKSTFPKSIEICIDLATANLSTILADPTQIHQVLMNLCVNALDAMPDSGTLTISADNFHVDASHARMNLEAKVGEYVVITVSDTGCGIPQELLERIFDPFFTTKELGKGTGLGLSTVIGIIKNHSGFIKVHSELGIGSQFQVYLSAIDTSATEEADDSQILARGNGELILVVDDEVFIQDVAKTSLKEFNYRVMIASDGIEALLLYAQHKTEISVVLMDIQIPSLDGLQAIRVLQQINPSVKIIVISGLRSNQQLLDAKNINVQAFLSKPYTIQELINTLKQVLSAS